MSSLLVVVCVFFVQSLSVRAVALEDHVAITYTKRSHCNDDLPVAANLSLALGDGLSMERQNEIDFAHQQIASIRFIIFMVPPCGTIRNYSLLNISLATFMMSFTWPSPFHTMRYVWIDLGKFPDESNLIRRAYCAKKYLAVTFLKVNWMVI